MLNNIKCLYLHCVFHGIRFKVSNEDWSSVTDDHFFALIIKKKTSTFTKDLSIKNHDTHINIE